MQPNNGFFTPVGLGAPKARIPVSASAPTGTATSMCQWEPEGPSKAFKCGGSQKQAPTGRTEASVQSVGARGHQTRSFAQLIFS